MAKINNLSYLLEKSGAEEKKDRLRFYRSLVPNAALVRGPDGFVCGLCGASYAVRSQAQTCLQTCLHAREDEGVVTVAALGESYACPRCGKRFARREDAIDCHGRVRRLSKIFLAQVPEKGARNWDDSSFAGLKETDKPGKGRLFRESLRLEAMVPFVTTRDFLRARSTAPTLGEETPKPSKANPVPEISAPRPIVARASMPLEHQETQDAPPRTWPLEPVPRAPSARVQPNQLSVQQAEVEAAPAPESPQAQSEEDGPFREKGMKPFTRHDARYKCSVCAKMYFTRSEVENCFFSHPERMV